MASTETRARLRIRKALEEDGHHVVTLHGDATSGRGRSDLVVCARGVYFWLEVKTLDGSPSPAQLRRIREVRVAGGIACLITSIYEARWVIDTRLKGYVPYMADEPGVQTTLDLSSFRRVAVPADPDAIPFPDPIPIAVAPPVPDHIVVETGEIFEPVATVADAALDSMLAQVQNRITAQQAAAPPAPPSTPDPKPEEKPKRGGRKKAEPAAGVPPEQELPPIEGEPYVPPSATASGVTLETVLARVNEIWETVGRVENLLAAEMALLGEHLNSKGEGA